MNITIFGATGSIGRLLVEQAFADGHDVTAITRDAGRVSHQHDRLQVMEGEVTEPAACLPAVKDADAVVVTLGAGRKGAVREAGTCDVVAAMEQHDPAVGQALSLLHENVAHPWTVAELAAPVGVSRAALGRRFTVLLRQPPMSYLAEWRLALAADLLVASDATVAAVARQVGYGSPFSLSAAFKRVHSVSPQQYRLVRTSG